MHFIVKNDFVWTKHLQFLLNNERKTHVTPWLSLFLLMKKRLTIKIKIVLSQFEVYTVILCEHQLSLLFAGESFYNHQLNLLKITNVAQWQTWNDWNYKMAYFICKFPFWVLKCFFLLILWIIEILGKFG